MLLMLEIIGIGRNLLRSLFNALFRFGGNTGSSLQGCGQYGFYEGVLSSRGVCSYLCERRKPGRFLWHQPLNLFSHVQKGHGKPQMVLAAS